SHKDILIDHTIDRILQLINNLDHHSVKYTTSLCNSLCIAAQRQGRINPERANELFQQAIEKANQLEHNFIKHDIIADIARFQIMIDPELAIPTADLISDERAKDAVLLAIVEAQALIHSDQAITTANRIHNVEYKACALLTIAQAQVATNPAI